MNQLHLQQVAGRGVRIHGKDCPCFTCCHQRDDDARRELQAQRDRHVAKFGAVRVDSSKWTGETRRNWRADLRHTWFRFRMWFCLDCEACHGDGRLMLQVGMSSYGDVQCDRCNGRRTEMGWLEAVGYRLAFPFLLLCDLADRAAWWALRFLWGPCVTCGGSGVERIYDEEAGETCSMCAGKGHALAYYATMRRIEEDIRRPGGCSCSECLQARGYDV